MTRGMASRSQRGFTLIEVMVAVLLVAIGIFGFAKMQALALVSTQTASSRAVVAMQANSLAAAMHGNRGFWADGGLVVATFSTGAAGLVTDATGVLKPAAAPACDLSTKPATAACTRQQIAARDVGVWALSLSNLLPSATSQTTCSISANVPVSCVLTITWTERYVNASKNTAVANTNATDGSRTYTLYIEP